MFWLQLVMPWLRPRGRLIQGPRAFARGLKAAAPVRPRACGKGGARRGLMMVLPSQWRCAGPGSNHIPAFGAWRSGSRRPAPRRNRRGETRWHRPFRPLPCRSQSHAS